MLLAAGNFRDYALFSQRTHAFDLMLVAVCCGAFDLARLMWQQADSPLRAALLASDFVKHLEVRRYQEEELRPFRTFFREMARGVLECLPTDARSQVLIAMPEEGESTWLGVELLGRSVTQQWRRRWEWWRTLCNNGRGSSASEESGQDSNSRGSQDVLRSSGTQADFFREAEKSKTPRPPLLRRVSAGVGDAARSRAEASRDAPCCSILDVAINLSNKEFVAHPYCQAVLDEFWCGNSARCGKVALRKMPSVPQLFTQVLILIPLLPPVICIDLTRRAVKRCLPQRSGTAISELLVVVLKHLPLKLLPTCENHRYNWDKLDKHGQPDFDISTVEEMLQLFHVPLVKRIVYITSHTAYTALFVATAFQPLCGPMNASHAIFGYWLACRALHQSYHLIRRRATWWRGFITLVELSATALLLTAAALRASLDPTLFAPPPSANSQADWRAGRINQGAATGVSDCGWSPQYETLRTSLAFSALALLARCSEVFFLSKQVHYHLPPPLLLSACSSLPAPHCSLPHVHPSPPSFLHTSTFQARSGVLILCASRMLKNMLITWLPPMFLVTTAFGVGLNLLAPDAPQLSIPSTSVATASSDFTLNLAVDGTFWAPFWGIFDMYYDPHDIAAMESSAILTPVFTWFYLLVALVLFVNLLIAVFNAE